MRQVSALALTNLQQEAFAAEYEEKVNVGMETCGQNMISRSPTFQFWDTILHLELLGRIFVNAHRTRKFMLFVESLKSMSSCFFALDHQN